MEVNSSPEGHNVSGDYRLKASFTSKVQVLVVDIYKYALKKCKNLDKRVFFSYLYVTNRDKWIYQKFMSTSQSIDRKILQNRLVCLKKILVCLQNQDESHEDELNKSKLRKGAEFQKEQYQQLYIKLGLQRKSRFLANKEKELEQIVDLKDNNISENKVRTSEEDERREKFNKHYEDFKEKIKYFLQYSKLKRDTELERLITKDCKQKELKKTLENIEPWLNSAKNDAEKIYDQYLKREYFEFLKSSPNNYLSDEKDSKLLDNLKHMVSFDKKNLSRLLEGQDYINLSASAHQIHYDLDIETWSDSDFPSAPKILIEEKIEKTIKEIRKTKENLEKLS